MPLSKSRTSSYRYLKQKGGARTVQSPKYFGGQESSSYTTDSCNSDSYATAYGPIESSPFGRRINLAPGRHDLKPSHIQTGGSRRRRKNSSTRRRRKNSSTRRRRKNSSSSRRRHRHSSRD